MDTPLATRDGILKLLRQKSQTVQVMEERLGLTRNAILFSLKELETKGLVQRAGSVRSGKAGKPAVLYEIIPRKVEVMSPAYQALAPYLLKAAVDLAPEKAAKTLQNLGCSIHATLVKDLGIGTRLGLDAALAFLKQQGAEIEVREEVQETVVLSHSCPIGLLVRTDKRICGMIASLLGEATGQTATDDCQYEDKFTCRFKLRPKEKNTKTGAQLPPSPLSSRP